jgi:transcriptional enhancer factor
MLTCKPTVLVYMATPEDDKKRSREHKSSHAQHMVQTRSHHQSHRPASTSRYEHDSPTAHLWAGSESLASSYGINTRHSSTIPATTPYAVTDFTMYVGINDQPVHYFTQLASDGRFPDHSNMSTSTWRRQYPEFKFLRDQMDEWAAQGRKILLCNASIKIMTEARPNASLSITFNLDVQRDLTIFESMQCVTRFYDSGDNSADPQFDGPEAHDLKEHRTPCEYMPNPHGPNGCLQIAFGSKFWVNRMMKYQSLRHRDDGCISKSLLRLTATQDVYGIRPGTGEAECLLTILWRFEQTRSSAEVGSMNWRAVSFDAQHPVNVEQRWIEEKIEPGLNLQDMNGNHGAVMDCSVSAPHETSLYQQVSHMPLDFVHQHPSHHGYGLHDQHPQHPPQLHLDVIASLQPDLEHTHASSAPSASTDYSQHSLPSLTHSQDAVGLYAQDPNDFDFNGGHITITGAFDPAINMSAYDSLDNQNAGLDGLHGLVGLDQDGYNLGLACAAGNELVDVTVNNGLQDGSNLACYSTKPNWQHTNLITHLENAAEQYHPYVHHGQATHGHDNMQRHHHIMAGPSPALTQGEDLVTHGLRDAHVNVNHGLCYLQSPFHEDTAGGACDGQDCRKDSIVHGHDVGLGLLDLIEQDPRSRRY